jgi:cell division septum initiation protein DivIVA
MAKTQALGIEPIERLEEKVRLLVNLLEKLRADQGRLAEENRALRAQIDQLESRVAEAESTGADIAALREERELVRARVEEILGQLEGLQL